MKVNVKVFKMIGQVFLFVITLFVLFVFLKIPSHDKNWEIGQEKLAYYKINTGSSIEIFNIRDFDWKDKNIPNKIEYKSQIFDLDKIKKTWLVISHFSDIDGIAHAFLRFEFDNGQFLSISVESRREIGEKYSIFKGLLREYELIYIVGTDRDVMDLRTKYRKEDVYAYPLKIDQKNTKKLFLSIVNEVNDIYENPKFYNSIFTNCATEIIKYIKEISDQKISIKYKLLPGYSDEFLFDNNYIDNNEDLTLEELRLKYKL